MGCRPDISKRNGLCCTRLAKLTTIFAYPNNSLDMAYSRIDALAFRVCVRTAKYNGNYGSIEVDHRYWLDNLKNEEMISHKNLYVKNILLSWQAHG